MTIKKQAIIAFAAILITFLIINTANAEGIFNFGNDKETTETDDTLVVGFNNQFPPFTYINDNGEVSGFDMDLAKEVCKRNNWTFQPQPIIGWNTKELELNSNEVDCIWSEFTINGREDDYTWSEPYFNNSQVVIVKTDSNISKLSDLKGKNVEVQEGNSVLKTLDENKTLKNSFKQLTEVDEYDVAMMNLESGVCDAIIADSCMANYQVSKNSNGNDYKILDEIISEEQYGIGFKKGNDELKNQVQKTLDEMFKDGTVEKIAQNYTEYKIPEGINNP